ncbi:hypothetical protein AB4Z10_07700 [Bosea sp. RAF48]|uniref:hypothetical protein n=1 Tax=Bosea sp. RAF48 TaxID=3237480 RepID=UPI003F936751
MNKTALILCGLMLAPGAAIAGPTCSPSSDTARILSAASPSAIHRSWQGGKQLGYGWSLQVERSTRDATGTEYYVGDLYDADGHLSTRKVFAVESEWDCGP